jgi:hypothetical protein
MLARRIKVNTGDQSVPTRYAQKELDKIMRRIRAKKGSVKNHGMAPTIR